MYKIIKKERVAFQIRKFIKNYLGSFINLFVDSGIENEQIIISNYKNIAKMFKKQILEEIDRVFINEILPKKIGINGELSVIISIGNFRLFIDYKENKKEKIRYIENIEFYKK